MRAAYKAILRIVVVLVVWTSAAGAAHAARFALLIGNDRGYGNEVALRFAETDTTRLAVVLAGLGDFAPARATVLLGRSADEVRVALAELDARLRAAPGDNLVLVFYSGHADAQSLHLGSTSLPLAGVKDAVSRLPAATRILILDACQAGVLTRSKGGRPGAGFDIALGAPEEPRGTAILAASSASEMAQESDALGGSVFTHYLRVGLAGLADRDRDGAVSLGETFDYVSTETLAATMGTTAGPQHPTFRYDIAGREDLILTHPRLPGVGYGRVQLDVPGWYFVRRADGTIAAETVSHGGEVLALEAGAYEITRRERASLEVAAVDVPTGGTISVRASPARSVAFGRMVRKGGGPDVAYDLAASAAMRSALADLGPSVGAMFAARADFAAVSLELRLALGRAQNAGAHLEVTTWETSLGLAALRVFDIATLRRISLSAALGGEAGASRLGERLDDGTNRVSWSPFAGPVALADWAVARRLSLRAEVGVPVYAVRVQTDAGDETKIRPAVRVCIGGAVSF